MLLKQYCWAHAARAREEWRDQRAEIFLDFGEFFFLSQRKFYRINWQSQDQGVVLVYSPVYLSGFPFFGGYRNCTTFILQMAQHINFVMLQTGHQSMEGYMHECNIQAREMKWNVDTRERRKSNLTMIIRFKIPVAEIFGKLSVALSSRCLYNPGIQSVEIDDVGKPIDK